MTDPRRASALILVDAALGLDSPQTDGADTGLQSVLRKKWISEIISAVFLTNPSFTEHLLQSFITEKEKATPQWIALYQRPLSLRGSYQHIASWLPELVSARGQAKSDQLAAYGKLTYPVTMIWGEQDSITPLAQAVNLQRLIPRATLLRIPNAGHIPQIEEPEAFQRSLDQALRAIPR
jgi:pimeloyl-ACP methyl ester carboxylesterase